MLINSAFASSVRYTAPPLPFALFPLTSLLFNVTVPFVAYIAPPFPSDELFVNLELYAVKLAVLLAKFTTEPFVVVLAFLISISLSVIVEIGLFNWNTE